jgi:hypothetical protein
MKTAPNMKVAVRRLARTMITTLSTPLSCLVSPFTSSSQLTARFTSFSSSQVSTSVF